MKIILQPFVLLAFLTKGVFIEIYFRRSVALTNLFSWICNGMDFAPCVGAAFLGSVSDDTLRMRPLLLLSQQKYGQKMKLCS